MTICRPLNSNSETGIARDTGRNDDARAMLAEIYGWFTEGFNTADLREAKTLLDELNDGNRKVAG
jgi:predicted ATPase